MQLKKYTDYGLRVLMYLAAKKDDDRVTIDELSGIFNVPRNATFVVLIVTIVLGLITIWFGLHVSMKVVLSILLLITSGVVYNYVKCKCKV